MKQEIENILKKHGIFRLVKSKFIEDNYSDLFLNVQLFKCTYFDGIKLSFSELLYLYNNDLKKIPVCKNCKNKVEFKTFTEGYKQYCNTRCSANSKEKQNKIKQTCLEKYNSFNVSQNVQIKEKKKKTFQKNYKKDHIWSKKENEIRSCENTCLEKYGVDNIFKLKEIQDKIKEVFLEKYGSNSPMSSEEIKNKSTQTLLKNYGVINPMLSDILKEKSKETSNRNYGVDYPIQNEIVHKQSITTLIKNYGVKYPTQNKEVYQKSLDTLFKNYGVTNARYLQKKTRVSKIEEFIKQHFNAEEFVFNNKKYDFSIDNDVFEIDGDYFHPLKIEDLSFTQLNNTLNDFRKFKNLKNTNYVLHRVLISQLPKTLTIENLKKCAYQKNFNIDFDTIIISKDYFKTYKTKKGVDKTYKQIPMLISFCIEIGCVKLSKEELYLKIKNIIDNNIDFTFDNLTKTNIYIYKPLINKK